MYSRKHGLTLGFHGCDRSIVDDILLGKKELQPSTNIWDWLGHGIYFWEDSEARAWEFAETNKKDPAVIGAVIDLGYCLDLIEYKNLQLLKAHHNTLEDLMRSANQQMPENKKPKSSNEILIRNLDCAVIEFLHKQISRDTSTRRFDSVRSVFLEGEDLYTGAGFKSKTHIQLCIRNTNAIKGLFLPRKML